jgi:hypothetical protein
MDIYRQLTAVLGLFWPSIVPDRTRSLGKDVAGTLCADRLKRPKCDCGEKRDEDGQHVGWSSDECSEVG